MIEMFNSLLSNYKSKVRNPFFGTLASVWLIRNWSIVYALFNFDKDCTMQDKINFIQNYFNQKEFGWELFHIVSVSFVVLIITYVLLAFSRILTDVYYKWLEPLIITKIDKTAIYTTAAKLRLEGRISLLEKKLVKSEEDLASHIIEIDKANKDYNKLSSDKDIEIGNLTSEIDELIESNKFNALVSDKLQNYFDGLNLGSGQLDLIETFENKEIKRIVSPGNHSQTYSRLINAGLVLNDDEYINLTPLGKLFLEMRENRLSTNSPKVML